MGVIDFGTGNILVKFDAGPSDELFAVQGETAREYKFTLIDLNNQAIDTSSLELKMNVFVKRTKAGTAPSVRQDDGTFLMRMPQGLILEHDENAKYQLFIRDDAGNMLAQKEGPFKIFANRAYDSGSGTNLLFDFEEFQKALDMQETYLEQMSDNLDKTIIARDEAQASERESTLAKDESVQIKEELKDVLDAEATRQEAFENRTRTWNSWFDIFENTKTGWKKIFADWTATFTSWTTTFADWVKKFAGYETAEAQRVSNEETRVHAEDNRIANFKSWTLKMQEFIQNDANHMYNETQRKEEWNSLKSELETLMNQLKEIDAGNLQLQIIDVVRDLKGYVKFMQVNTVNNTIEVYSGNDVDNPSITLSLPKGFSGKYADLEGKPSIYTQAEIDSKLKGKVSVDGTKVLSDNNYDNAAKNKVDVIPKDFDYTLKDYAKSTDVTTEIETATKIPIFDTLPANLSEYNGKVIYIRSK